MVIAGIDGCKAGWLIVYSDKNQLKYQVINQITELKKIGSGITRVFIDMPIGLSSAGFKRTLESRLRKELGNRSSTIFNAPSRSAVYEADKDKAKAINKKIEGKSLSEQTLNIKSKILELDRFLITGIDNSIQLIESHPEICFKYLNGTILQTKKSQEDGIEERLAILSKYDSTLADFYQKILKETLRKDVKKDDIVDALALYLSNYLNAKKLQYFIEDENNKDERGLKVRLGYFDPTKTLLSN